MATGKWGGRLAGSARVLAVLGVVVAGGGLLAARHDVLPKMQGFTAFLGGGALALIAGVLALVALLLLRKTAGPARGKALLALVLAVPLAGYIFSRPMAAGNVPAIHDITTDLQDPPAFATLKLREDNLVGVDTVENWRRLHAGAYADLKPLRLERPVAKVMADVRKHADSQGWTIAADDPATGHFEATASVSFIRFQDDIVVRVRPDGDGSIVDVRSVSRIGVSDLGVNAKRIRALQAALKAG